MRPNWSTRRRAVLAAAAIPGLLVAGCATSPSGTTASPAPHTATPSAAQTGTPSPARPADPRHLIAAATVLDAGHGPRLCLGAVAGSSPPKCGGPPLDRWVWPKSGVERASGVTWGHFFVVGAYDGGRFRVQQVVTARQAVASLPRQPATSFATVCAAPQGGWRPVDPNRISQTDRDDVLQAADRLPGFGGSWIDDQGNPAQPPQTTVINVRVTTGLAAAERTLRAVWGGPLCVSRAAHTDRELASVLNSVSRLPGFLVGDYGQGFVDLTVVFDDGTLQRRLDRRFGAGLVHVDSALRPYLG